MMQGRYRYFQWVPISNCRLYFVCGVKFLGLCYLSRNRDKVPHLEEDDGALVEQQVPDSYDDLDVQGTDKAKTFYHKLNSLVTNQQFEYVLKRDHQMI